MQIAIENKLTGKHKVIELDDSFGDIQPENILVHLGMSTFTLQTTLTKEQQEEKRKIELFQKETFNELIKEFSRFGEISAGTPEHAELLKNIEIAMIEKLSKSVYTKTIYESSTNKAKLVREQMVAFAHYVALIKGVQEQNKAAVGRRTDECFPLDYAQRILTIMRDILQDKYESIEKINKDFSQVFQDASIDTRPHVGIPKLITGLQDMTRLLADITNAGRPVDILEARQALHSKAEVVVKVVNEFKNDCIKAGKNIVTLHDDKFADYILKFYNQTTKCIDALTSLDKQYKTSNMDELELRHYIDTILEQLYTECDELLLQYTMDERDKLPECENAYIVGYHTSILSTCNKKDETDNRYTEAFRHLLNLNKQQHTLFIKMKFPDTLEEFKKYVETEFTNILQRNSLKE